MFPRVARRMARRVARRVARWVGGAAAMQGVQMPCVVGGAEGCGGEA